LESIHNIVRHRFLIRRGRYIRSHISSNPILNFISSRLSWTSPRS
jgi:hypothetical protein